MRKFIITFFILTAILISGLYLVKELLFNKFSAVLIEKFESSTGHGITIEKMSYMPVKGFHLKGLTIYGDRTLSNPILSIRDSSMKFSVLNIIKNKKFTPKVTLHRLKLGNVFANGSFSFSMDVADEIISPQNLLDSMDSLSLYDFSVITPSVRLEKINGSIFIGRELIKSSGFSFVLNGTAGIIDLEIVDPLNNLSSNLTISSSKFDITSRIKQEKDIYKILKLKGTVLNSAFDFTGEFGNLAEGNLSLYGTTKINIKDLSFFIPEESKELIKAASPSGLIESSVFFSGSTKDLSTCELGIKSKADSLSIYNIKIDNLTVDARLKDKILTLPLAKCFIYGGAFVSDAQIDFSDKSLPCQVSAKLNNFNLSTYFDSTKVQNHDIRGLVSIDFNTSGNAKDSSSQKGSGSIVIQDANLGPMPFLSPLVGYSYSYLHKVFPKLRKVNITSGSCTFTIAQRKLTTNDVVLRGDMMNIYAKGYMDFDRKLDFLVRNEFVKSEKKEVTDWQSGLQELLVNTSNFINDAHLTGTLEKPKWEFKYLAGMKNILEGGLGKTLKDILK